MPEAFSSLANRSVVILGIKRQGTALARFFCAAGARVRLSDLSDRSALSDELTELNGLPVDLILGAHPISLLDGCDLLCLSGGVPPQIPIVQEAIRRRIPLSNDTLLTLQCARAPVIAISGSSGKTTTTTLVGEMLSQNRHDGEAPRKGEVHVGGNIGRPLIDRMGGIGARDQIVLELSSFQLEIFDPEIAEGRFTNLGPDVAALLNITPNHLDRHPSMAAYVDAKLNLVRHLRPESHLILSGDDPVTAAIADLSRSREAAPLPAEWKLQSLIEAVGNEMGARGIRPSLFGLERKEDATAWMEGGMLMYRGETICRREEVRLRGEHNVSNLLAAAAISGAVGASVEAMRSVATEFSGVPHRLEEVGCWAGVSWINDSIATAPERAVAGLRVFEPGKQTLILLAGGKDKNLPWDVFADEALKRVNYLIGFGSAGDMIVDVVRERAQFRQINPPGCAVVRRLEEAVELAARIAQNNSVVLLSPGGTSFDAYNNFEERGNHFRRLVAALQATGVSPR